MKDILTQVYTSLSVRSLCSGHAICNRHVCVQNPHSQLMQLNIAQRQDQDLSKTQYFASNKQEAGLLLSVFIKPECKLNDNCIWGKKKNKSQHASSVLFCLLIRHLYNADEQTHLQYSNHLHKYHFHSIALCFCRWLRYILFISFSFPIKVSYLQMEYFGRL